MLRCRRCFGEYFYNQIDPLTGEQFTWGTIAQALASGPLGYVTDVRPVLYEQVAFPPRPRDVHALIHSVQLAAAALGIDFDDVKSQIVKYFVDLEAPNGPKRLLRLGRWDKFLDNITTTYRRLCRKMDRARVPAQKNAFECLAAQVLAAREKWFVKSPGFPTRWVPSVRAAEVSMRLAEIGDPRGVCKERRRVRLFDYGPRRVVVPPVDGDEGGDSAGDDTDRYNGGDDDDGTKTETMISKMETRETETKTETERATRTTT